MSTPVTYAVVCVVLRLKEKWELLMMQKNIPRMDTVNKFHERETDVGLHYLVTSKSSRGVYSLTLVIT